MKTSYSREELQRAYERSTLVRHAGMTLDRALATPEFAALLKTGAAIHRQTLRQLARQARGRFIERTCTDWTREARDAYELTDRDAHLGEVPA